jgi:hypothetical protein
VRVVVFEVVLGLYLAASQAFGQGITIAGAGYSPPGTLVVTPGQLVTIFVAGIGTGITQRLDAGVLPLPTKLAGISVSWSQLGNPPSPVPLLSVFPTGTCTQGGRYPPCSTLVGITLQIPYELYVYQGGLGTIVWASLLVSEGTATGEIDFYGIEPNPHVIHFGDTIVPQPRMDADAVVAHSDGTLVTLAAPAKVGEMLTLYATGLGRTMPFVAAGAPAPSPAATTFAQVELAFDYGLNLSLAVTYPPYYRPYPERSPQTISLGPTQVSDPLPGWLVPGLVGIYQVNFQVPVPAPGVPSCNGLLSPSNLTISFVGTSEFGAICVDTTSPSTAASSVRPAFQSARHFTQAPAPFAGFPQSDKKVR